MGFSVFRSFDSHCGRTSHAEDPVTARACTRASESRFSVEENRVSVKFSAELYCSASIRSLHGKTNRFLVYSAFKFHDLDVGLVESCNGARELAAIDLKLEYGSLRPAVC